MIFRKQKLNVLKAVAKQHGVTEAEVRREMELAITEAKENADPVKQAEFKKLFGDNTPTPEEFIMKVSREVSKENGGMNGVVRQIRSSCSMQFILSYISFQVVASFTLAASIFASCLHQLKMVHIR